MLGNAQLGMDEAEKHNFLRYVGAQPQENYAKIMAGYTKPRNERPLIFFTVQRQRSLLGRVFIENL